MMHSCCSSFTNFDILHLNYAYIAAITASAKPRQRPMQKLSQSNLTLHLIMIQTGGCPLTTIALIFATITHELSGTRLFYLWSLTVKRSLACLSTQGGRGSRSTTTIIDFKSALSMCISVYQCATVVMNSSS